MPLPFQRSESDPLAPSEPPAKRLRKAAAATPDATVDAARTRARRRLVGAVVLLAIGIIAFPMLFDSRPRPLALDTPIEIAQREPRAAPVDAEQSSQVRASASEAAETVLESNPRPSTAASAPAAAPAAVPTVIATRPAATAPAPLPPMAKPEPEPTPSPKPTPAPTPKPARSDDGARARALLEGAPVAAAAAPKAPSADRFVVQVGAFSEAGALREARGRVEHLGLKSYTQVVASDAGRRTRVRVGPFASRAEAEAAAAKLKRGGLPASVLTL